jgi:hypothetical protein
MYILGEDTFPVHDPILWEKIPVEYAIEIDDVMYDARWLLEQTFHDKARKVAAWRLPHNRRRLYRFERYLVLCAAAGANRGMPSDSPKV